MDKLLQQAPCGIVSFNDDGIIQQANAAFCSLIEYEEAEVTGKNINSFFTLATRIFYQTHFSFILKLEGMANEIYITLLTKRKHEVPVLVNGKRSVEGDNGIITCACMALYHRKKFEDELIQAKKLAETALNENAALLAIKTDLQTQTESLDKKIAELLQRNTDLEQLNNIIAHDLQEPLRKMQVFADMLKHYYATDNDQANSIVNKLVSISEYMRELLRGLQKYLWLDNASSPVKEVDINKLLLVVQQQLSKEYGVINYQLISDSLLPVEGHWDQLVILFYQLISNSIKFRSPVRPLQISIKGLVIRQNKFKSLENKYQYVDFLRIEYEDNGVGFDEHLNNQVFDLLKKMDKTSKGLGIGLTMCKKIVSNHGGSITASGNENKGAKFTILLPVHQY